HLYPLCLPLCPNHDTLTDTLASLRRLAGYSFDALLAGHLNFSLHNGYRHVATACAMMDKLRCPPSLL
ncbi:MAG: hypothetical protein ACUVSF_12670, partial [Anaerolineae bacterium]